MPIPFVVVAFLLLANLAAYLAFWRDKRMAKAGAQRIPERTLLLLALLGGSIGAVFAQQALRHKTQKEPFRTWLSAIVCLHAALATTSAAILLALGISR